MTSDTVNPSGVEYWKQVEKEYKVKNGNEDRIVASLERIAASLEAMVNDMQEDRLVTSFMIPRSEATHEDEELMLRIPLDEGV